MDLVGFVKKYQMYFKIALLIVVLSLIFRFISSIDFSQLKEYFYKIPFAFLGVIGSSFLAYISATLAWRLCLTSEQNKSSMHELFMIRHVGEMLSLFNPTSIVAGESLKAVYLKKQGVDSEVAISSILMSRVLIILSAILLILISLLYIIVGYANEEDTFLIIIALFLILGAYLLSRFMLHKNLFFAKLVERIKRITGWSFITEKTVASAYETNLLVSSFYKKNKLNFILAFLLSIIHWGFGAAEFYIIIRALGVDLSFFNAMVIEMGVIVFKSMGAVVPGQLGVEEYGNKVMLDIIGITSNEIWLVVSVVRRARQLFWLMVAGVFTFFIGKFTKPVAE